MKIFESELRGKSVMSDEGTYLGILRNTTMNPKTGELVAILVEPSEEIDRRLYTTTETGYIQFPFTSVKNVRNVVIVGAT